MEISQCGHASTKTGCVSAVTVNAPAKLNLYLDITGRRENGYHLMDMVMQAVDLHDTVTISVSRSGISSLCCNGSDVPQDKSNTALRAVSAFFKHTGIANHGIDICIEKNIPSQAGLGGASSDAAAVFVGLDQLFDTNIPISELCCLGASVGADVPFCILGGTAHASGIGEILTPLPAISSELFFVIIKPEYGVSTVEAFSQFDQLPEKPVVPPISGILNAISAYDYNLAGKFFCNAFEPVVFPENTLAIKRNLLQEGALGSVMSGSGSSVFGLFDDFSTASHACASLSEFGETFLVKPVSIGAHICD